MTTPIDRITAIVEEHLTCECGNWAEDMHENCAHVAQQIATELNLTEEMTTIYAPCEIAEDGSMHPRWHEFYDDEYQGRKAAQAEQRPLGRAWVSGWSAVELKPAQEKP